MIFSSHGIAWRVTGSGPLKVLLLHALTGGPDAADRNTPQGCIKGWWSQAFKTEAPLDPSRCTVWTPNLPGSCYGSTANLSGCQTSTRDQAQYLLAWMEDENLEFDLLLGASLGGMVALELALLAPERFQRVAVIGCGARSDAWIQGANELQLAILQSPALSDSEAINLARRAAMLTFRSPESINGRFQDGESIRDWLGFHGRALAERFTRNSYITLLQAMDNHDLGRNRDGLAEALSGLRAPLHILGMTSDLFITPERVQELHDTVQSLGLESRLDWIESPHGHDAFLMEWQPVMRWLHDVTDSCKLQTSETTCSLGMV